MRRLLLGGSALIVSVGGALGLPLTASAHALAQSSDPAPGAVLQQPPHAVTITFGEEPDPKLSRIDVLDASGQNHVSAPTRQVPGNARQLTVPLTPLSKGVYTVAWRTVSAVDGHHAAGSFAFGVQVAPGAVATANASAVSSADSGRPSALAVAARWAFYLGLLALLGAACVGAVVAGPTRALVVMCALAWILAGVGAGSITLAQAVDAGVGWSQVFQTSLGHALLLRGIPVLLTGAGVLATALLPRHRRPLLVAIGVGAAASMLGDVLDGHAAAGSAEAVSIALQWIHICAGGIWLGGLTALLVTVRGAPGESKARAIRRFSFTAGIALAAVLATGIVRAAIEIGSWGDVLSTDFGRLVVAKIVLIAALAGLGAVNRWRNVPVSARRLSGLRRVGSVELGVAGLAVLTAAALVNVAPPVNAAGPATPPAPPPPLVIDASDYATTLRFHLEISPGTSGFNTFTARLTAYDTGAPLTARDIQLSFAFPLRSDIGESTLILEPTSPGTFTATGGNLSLEGPWVLRALVERGAQSVDVSMNVLPRSAPQQIQVSRAPGQPTIYTIDLGAGRSVQVYLDPGTPGANHFHATFFGADGNELTVNAGQIAVTPQGGAPSILPIQQLDPGHYVAAETLRAGEYRFDVSGLDPAGNVVGTHLDVTVSG